MLHGKGQYRLGTLRQIKHAVRQMAQHGVPNIAGDGQYIAVSSGHGGVTIRFLAEMLPGLDAAVFPAVIQARPANVGGGPVYGWAEIDPSTGATLTEGRSGALGTDNEALELNGRCRIPPGTRVSMHALDAADATLFWFDICAGLDQTVADLDAADDAWDIQDQADGEYGAAVSPLVSVEYDTDGTNAWVYRVYSRQKTFDSNGNLIAVAEPELVLEIPRVTTTAITALRWDSGAGRLVSTVADLDVYAVRNSRDATIDATLGGDGGVSTEDRWWDLQDHCPSSGDKHYVSNTDYRGCHVLIGVIGVPSTQAWMDASAGWPADQIFNVDAGIYTVSPVTFHIPANPPADVILFEFTVHAGLDACWFGVETGTGKLFWNSGNSGNVPDQIRISVLVLGAAKAAADEVLHS
jgi:hypothetical protein